MLSFLPNHLWHKHSAINHTYCIILLGFYDILIGMPLESWKWKKKSESVYLNEQALPVSLDDGVR